MSELKLLDDRIKNLTTGLLGMADSGTMQVSKAFLESVREYMVELLALRRAQPDNAPMTLCFGRGELGVGTAYEAPAGPPREINIRRLSAPLPIASSTGDKGKYVDELENVLVRMRFENAESAHVLERAVRTVLAGFGHIDNAPITLDELRGMDGERVWLDNTGHSANSGWHLVNAENEFLIDMYGWKIPLCCLGNERIVYRRKPEGGEG